MNDPPDGADDSGNRPGEGRLAINRRLLEILVCPVSRGILEYDRERQELLSRKAKLAFPIRDGIPIMLPEEARAITG